MFNSFLNFDVFVNNMKKPQVWVQWLRGLGVAKPVPDRVDRNRVDFRVRLRSLHWQAARCSRMRPVLVRLPG